MLSLLSPSPFIYGCNMYIHAPQCVYTSICFSMHQKRYVRSIHVGGSRKTLSIVKSFASCAVRMCSSGMRCDVLPPGPKQSPTQMRSQFTRQAVNVVRAPVESNSA